MRILIAGQGLAGTALAWHCHHRGIPFTLADPLAVNTSSWVASGLFNPVVLKRRTLVWKAAEMMQGLLPFYRGAEVIAGSTFVHERPIVHQIMDYHEENQWQGLLADERFQPFLDSIQVGQGPFSRGVSQLVMRGTGWINVPAYLAQSRRYFAGQGCFFHEAVPHALEGPPFWFQGQAHSHLVWASGSHHPELKPYFRPTIGEVLTVRLPDFPQEAIYHGKLFLIPLGDSLFRMGATYRPVRGEVALTTEEGQQQLLADLQSMTDRVGTVVEHHGGIRTNTMDRRPLLGSLQPGQYHLNGLGSRGVLISHWLAETLLNHWVHGNPLPQEISIPRP
jgi:glycine/D-amino acid oxidase-like deaminating enzyme